jgi:hypothetical protein
MMTYPSAIWQVLPQQSDFVHQFIGGCGGSKVNAHPPGKVQVTDISRVEIKQFLHGDGFQYHADSAGQSGQSETIRALPKSRRAGV